MVYKSTYIPREYMQRARKSNTVLKFFSRYLLPEVRGRIACGHCTHRELGRDYLDHALHPAPTIYTYHSYIGALRCRKVGADLEEEKERKLDEERRLAVIEICRIVNENLRPFYFSVFAPKQS